MMVAGAMSLLLGFAAIGIELGRIYRVKSNLQHAADSAALAGARELSMAGTDKSVIAGIASGAIGKFVDTNTAKLTGVSVDTRVGLTPLEVAVSVSADMHLPFGGIIGTPSIRLASTSVARVVGQPNLCVLGLDSLSPGTVSLGTTANVHGKSCSVFSNSTSGKGLVASGGSVLTASTICSAGGVDGQPSNFNPTALTDCPKFNDPLASRPAPPTGGCTFTDVKIRGSNVRLKPGVYCGGISVHSQAIVTLEPGIYVIRGGEFEVGTKASITGTGVGLYFEGAHTSIRFKSDSIISLRAPTDGPMAGILIFGDRNQPASTIYTINSENARVLVGTIYLPNATLLVDAAKPVGDLSEYTAIVARVVEFRNGRVVLNTDYAMTDVPVPDGIKGAGQPIALYR